MAEATIKMSNSQPQTASIPNGEEMVKRILVVAELLARGKISKKDSARAVQEKSEKTQDAKPVVSY
jgi:hypothetical protein